MKAAEVLSGDGGEGIGGLLAVNGHQPQHGQRPPGHGSQHVHAPHRRQ
jgi:hypothetical protein